GFLTDGLANVVLLASTLWVVEHRCRSRSGRPQFGLSTILALTFIAASILSIPRSALPLQGLPWFLIAPNVFAVGCTIYIALLLITLLTAWCFRLVARRRAPTGDAT